MTALQIFPRLRSLVARMLVGDDVGYQLSRDLVLGCPWRAYEDDLDTGRSIVGPDRSGICTFNVSVEDGLAWLTRGGRPSAQVEVVTGG